MTIIKLKNVKSRLVNKYKTVIKNIIHGYKMGFFDKIINNMIVKSMLSREETSKNLSDSVQFWDIPQVSV